MSCFTKEMIFITDAMHEIRLGVNFGVFLPWLKTTPFFWPSYASTMKSDVGDHQQKIANQISDFSSSISSVLSRGLNMQSSSIKLSFQN